jgi:hypothetical protein
MPPVSESKQIEPLSDFAIEVESLRAVANALMPLDKAARERVIRWAIQYFNANDFRGGF